MHVVSNVKYKFPRRAFGYCPFWSAQKLIDGIKIMHTVKKGELHCPNGQSMSEADQFYSLVFISGVKREQAWPVDLIATKTVNLINPMLMA
jgi:hypothetical protein